MSSSASDPPPLIHIHTLPSPHGRTRAWSSTPHPSSSTPLLAIASADKSVSIWSLRDFRFLSTITGGHKRSVRCVGWKDYGSPSTAPRSQTIGKKKPPVTLATGSFDANVGIWVHSDRSAQQVQDEPILGAEEEDELPQDQSDEIDISKTEANGDDEDEEEWHFSTLLTGPDSEIKSLAFSPPHYSANLLATSSRDKSVWVWEEVEDDEWETIAVLAEHAGDVKCVAWNTGALMHPGSSSGGQGDDGGESRIIAGRELLASGAYDDTIRLWRDIEEEGDWGCVGVIEGHGGTVWSVKFEGHINYDCVDNEDVSNGDWEPRLLSCSDDLSVRVWRREMSEAEREKKRRLAGAGTGASGAQRLPSIIRPVSTMERWVQDAVLPPVHVRSVYAIDWSRRTGLVVSCGGDGTIAVYREIPDLGPNPSDQDGDGDVVMNGTNEHGHEQQQQESTEAAQPKKEKKRTKWIILYQIEAAHDEYEINHVCWATRLDAGRKSDEEEMIVSTGDDGDVRLWALP